MMKANKNGIFKVLTQYNFGVKHNIINRVSEFYKIHDMVIMTKEK